MSAKQTADENRLCYVVLEKPVIKCHKSVSRLGSKELDLEGNKKVCFSGSRFEMLIWHLGRDTM